MHLAKSHYTPLLVLLFALASLRIFVSMHFDLGVDEAHYVLYGVNVDLSYFDHPPLVGWLQFVALHLFGDSELSARIFAIFIGFISSLSLYTMLYSLHQNARAALFATLALNLSFIFGALFIMLLPDTLLFVLIIPIIQTLIKIEKESKTSSWLLLGLLLGLAGLAKYTAILFIPPLILYLLLKKRYDLFITPKLLLSVLLAFIVVSPVILWNIQNDWISFTYQSAHVVGKKSINLEGFLESQLVQIVSYNPFFIPLAFYGLCKSLKSKNDTLLLSALFGLVLLSFFTYSSLYSVALPHWSAPFYFLFIPIGSYFAYEHFKKYTLFSIFFGLLVTLVLYGELALKFLPQDNYNSLHRDIYGWKSILKKANKHLQNKTNASLALTNWTLASRAMFYNKKYNSSLYLIDKRYDQFDIWQKDDALGKDLLFIQTHFFEKNLKEYVHCTSLETLEKFDIKLHKKIVNSVSLVMCKNYKGIL